MTDTGVTRLRQYSASRPWNRSRSLGGRRLRRESRMRVSSCPGHRRVAPKPSFRSSLDRSGVADADRHRQCRAAVPSEPGGDVLRAVAVDVGDRAVDVLLRGAPELDGVIGLCQLLLGA
ncbi:hypothetical protein SVEN_6555 [Streptomyces venezuelae ATCC 10712]|uniref:Uncharacterized protein n=1 Tax=Streptomyces venezuelae (strain ATCC 10712 / CBS 650.69 / DSM 40230 / JCM 4526 / NBRC 13096 / PD 04745) TaxID=953739 RepID=F2RGC1_STRVP|nr:hypothetical protein SVEN_6555 [Streptomyces venezuelae ATCC 10712]